MKSIKELLHNFKHLSELAVIFFAPAFGQMLLVMFATLTDTITGVWASKKVGEPITSKRLSDFVPKIIAYFFVLILAHGIDVQYDLVDQKINAMSAVSLALLGVNLKSIDENFQKAIGVGLFKGITKLLKKK
jgi:ABC-type antimicrobial peptide transport system permease subunit